MRVVHRLTDFIQQRRDSLKRQSLPFFQLFIESASVEPLHDKEGQMLLLVNVYMMNLDNSGMLKRDRPRRFIEEAGYQFRIFVGEVWLKDLQRVLGVFIKLILSVIDGAHAAHLNQFDD